MHISDLHDYNPLPSQQAKDFLSQGSEKNVKRAIEQIIEEEFDRLEQYADEFISQTAASRAENFFKRLMRGDEQAAMALFGNASCDRYRNSGCDQGKPWAKLIHGHLFETNGITLRRQIVEAYPELLRNERIADLESIVDGLTRQVRELTARLEDRQ